MNDTNTKPSTTPAGTKPGAADVLERLRDWTASLEVGPQAVETPPEHVTLAPRKPGMSQGDLIAAQVHDLDAVFQALARQALAMQDPERRAVLIPLLVRTARQCGLHAATLADMKRPAATIINLPDSD
jgi:hypothetical protein